MDKRGHKITVRAIMNNLRHDERRRIHEREGGTTMKKDKRKPKTTDAGLPASRDEYSLTVGPDRPILLQDYYLIGQRNTIIHNCAV